ncbi:MAG TPA: ATP-binding protein [Gaiella sp.]|nr:ATP-binding protein [Gaiella sp.]
MPLLPRTRFSMRWWLALVFAGIAALTAVVVAQVFRSSSESAIRDRAAELTAGTAVAGASRVAAASNAIAARRVATDVATRRRIALFVFDDAGRLVTSDRVAGVDLGDVRDLETALAQALDGRRYVETDGETGAVTVALPIRGSDRFGAIVAFANRPDLEDALGIVEDEIINAALRATLVGALIGLVVAVLITRRLRRIASAAAAIERGRFEGELRSGFPDELGELAQTVDQMREHLAQSFADLEGERDRLRKLLEQLQEAVVAVDRSLRIVFANSRARQLLGTDAREGQLLPDPWPGVGLRAVITGLFDPDAGSTSLTIRPNADTTLVVAGLPPSRGSDTAVLVLTDVTLRERRERAEREFVANAAHELRTPLTAIGSAVDVLQAGAKDDADQRSRFIEVIERQSRRLNGLVEALLTLARAQTGAEFVRLDVVDLSPLLTSIGDDVAHGGRQLTIDCEPGLIALTHPELLRQALVNLVENAFTHGGGRDVVLSARYAGERVVVAVSDTGPGMASSQAERVLDRFYRGGNGGGYGLGLAIVREVARAIEGKVSISTEPGTGTTIALELGRAVAE